MTDKQHKLYIREWARVARVQGWRMLKGRLVGERKAACHSTEPARIYIAVWEAAEQLALRGSDGLRGPRAVTAEELRHACHVVAIGKNKSSWDFTNAEFDKVLNVLRLLANDLDLGAMRQRREPEIQERQRLVIAIQKLGTRNPELPTPNSELVHEAEVIHLAEQRKDWEGHWTPPYWEDLPIAWLHDLLHQCHAYQTAKAKRREKLAIDNTVAEADACLTP